MDYFIGSPLEKNTMCYKYKREAPATANKRINVKLDNAHSFFTHLPYKLWFDVGYQIFDQVLYNILSCFSLSLSLHFGQNENLKAPTEKQLLGTLLINVLSHYEENVFLLIEKTRRNDKKLNTISIGRKWKTQNIKCNHLKKRKRKKKKRKMTKCCMQPYRKEIWEKNSEKILKNNVKRKKDTNQDAISKTM